METHGGKDMRVGVSQGKCSPAGFKSCSDRNEASDACLPGPLDDISTVGVKIGEVEVAMGINQHSKGILKQGKTKKESFIQRTISFPAEKDEGRNLP